MTPLSNWKIVLIDDEEDIREVTQLMLSDAGYFVATAPDGETGLQLCERICPQIVITDIRMPGMDGIHVLETLKKQTPDTEVIVATAFGEMELAVRALQLDASDFITKPISDEALNLALERAKQRYTSRKQLKDYTLLLEKGWAKTAQELIQTFLFQENLIESSMDGILACDDHKQVIIFNKSMEQMLGYSKKDVVHQMSFSQFFRPQREMCLNEDMSGEKFGGKYRLFLYETELIDNHGNTIPVQVSATALFETKREIGRVFFFRDLREIRKLEREVADQARILHQDKMMSLGRLAASVVHEINNPLSGILNYVRLMIRLLQRGSLTSEQRNKFKRYLDVVETETNRCSQIVSNLLTFSRKSPPSFGPVSIQNLLDRCILLSQHKLKLSHIELSYTLAPDIPAVRGDFSQLQQCVINLIFNAIDAMPRGGILSLNGFYNSSKQRVIIQVKDSGPGILPEHLGHIFEPFFTTKKEGYGVGLGLSTVYGIMQYHKGAVYVQSQPDLGATFTLELPVIRGTNQCPTRH